MGGLQGSSADLLSNNKVRFKVRNLGLSFELSLRLW